MGLRVERNPSRAAVPLNRPRFFLFRGIGFLFITVSCSLFFALVVALFVARTSDIPGSWVETTAFLSLFAGTVLFFSGVLVVSVCYQLTSMPALLELPRPTLDLDEERE